MLTRLRRQLTLLSAACTGAVLLAMALAALSLAEGQLRAGSEAGFLSSANAIIAKLRSDRVVSTTWLAQLESGEGLIISLRDQGAPLSFSGAWTPRTARPLLLERAVAGARALGVEPDSPPLSLIDTTSTPVFEVRGDLGERYLASVTQIPSSQGWQSLVLLKDMSSSDQQLLLLRGSFAALVAAGVTALLLLCWAFAGRAIRPIEESRRKQAEFIAAASHELRSPLAVIRTSASALAVAPDQASRLRQNIKVECARMSRLVDDLLSLARSDAGTWTIARETVDMDTLLLETAELFCPVARQKGQRLLLEVPERDLPPVTGDPQRLRQVLSVLLDNAFSYTPQGGVVTLRAEVDGAALTLQVADTGPGISPQSLPYIFDRFYRADVSRTTKEHFGLGLSIAKELAALHGGTLRVARTGPEGTVFALRLPLHRGRHI